MTTPVLWLLLTSDSSTTYQCVDYHLDISYINDLSIRPPLLKTQTSGPYTSYIYFSFFRIVLVFDLL